MRSYGSDDVKMMSVPARDVGEFSSGGQPFSDQYTPAKFENIVSNQRAVVTDQDLPFTERCDE